MSKRKIFIYILVFIGLLTLGISYIIPDATTEITSHQLNWWEKTTNWVGLTEHPTEIVVKRPNQIKIWSLGMIAIVLMLLLCFVIIQLIRLRSFRRFDDWLNTQIWCRKSEPELQLQPEPSKV